jgi:hypothetical protein
MGLTKACKPLSAEFKEWGLQNCVNRSVQSLKNEAYKRCKPLSAEFKELGLQKCVNHSVQSLKNEAYKNV